MRLRSKPPHNKKIGNQQKAQVVPKWAECGIRCGAKAHSNRICCKWHVNVAKSLLLSILPSCLFATLSFLPSFLPLGSNLFDLLLIHVAPNYFFCASRIRQQAEANWSKVFLCRLLPAKLSRLRFSVSLDTQLQVHQQQKQQQHPY